MTQVHTQHIRCVSCRAVHITLIHYNPFSETEALFNTLVKQVFLNKSMICTNLMRNLQNKKKFLVPACV